MTGIPRGMNEFGVDEKYPPRSATSTQSPPHIHQMITQSTAEHHALTIKYERWTAEGANSMRTLATSAIAAFLIFGGPTLAQTQATPAPSNTETQSQESGVTIRSIQVVDVEDLGSDIRAKIDSLLENAKQEDLKSLRDSIDATPQAVSALKAKGRVSAQVVAINVDDNGILTMFTKKNA
ncbi:MAG: hypothetical protein ACTHNN_10965 [Xanthobacteraceae bacterium]